jgi:regulator of sigma E protease
MRSADTDVVTENVVTLSDWMHDIEEPNPVRELGVTLFVPEVVPKIETVVAGSPAQLGGMQTGDLVVAADGQSMGTWQEWVEYVRQRPEESVSVLV